MTKEELKKILKNHTHWLNKDCEWWESMRADLRGADLRYANLRNADLRGTNLSWANLSWATLYGADIHEAIFVGANLYGADLSGVSLRDASNVPLIPIACPSEGEFIAWKKVKYYLIKLKIPEDAKRLSATTNKCRCDKALVLAIDNIYESGENLTEVVNENYGTCVYRVGEMIYPDSFDEDRWNECSHGIHFFIDKREAINY